MDFLPVFISKCSVFVCHPDSGCHFLEGKVGLCVLNINLKYLALTGQTFKHRDNLQPKFMDIFNTTWLSLGQDSCNWIII